MSRSGALIELSETRLPGVSKSGAFAPSTAAVLEKRKGAREAPAFVVLKTILQGTSPSGELSDRNLFLSCSRVSRFRVATTAETWSRRDGLEQAPEVRSGRVDQRRLIALHPCYLLYQAPSPIILTILNELSRASQETCSLADLIFCILVLRRPR